MAFPDSLLGKAIPRLWSNPISGVAGTFGLGAGVFAGASTFASTDGSLGDKADAGASSAVKYGLVGGGLVGAAGIIGANASAFRAGYDRYQGTIDESIGYGAAKGVKGASGMASKAAGRAGSYAQDIAAELRTPGGWKSAIQRPGISGGLGALVGGVIGRKVTDDSNTGTAVGAAVGAGAGVAIGRVAKASSVWSKWGPVARGGSIIAASVAIGGALKVLAGSEPEEVATAQPEDSGYGGSGIRDRMNRIGAQGDLVFGLHRGR